MLKRLLEKIKKKIISVEPGANDYNDAVFNDTVHSYTPNYEKTDNIFENPPTQSTNNCDNKMGRLMELIGLAIEEWAKEYHLENLPKRILFEQALDAMRVIEHTMDNQKY